MSLSLRTYIPRDPTPRAVTEAVVPRGTSILGSRYALLVSFLAKEKSTEKV